MDVTMTQEQLELSINILMWSSAVAGTKILASKLQQHWEYQADPEAEPKPLTLTDDECKLAHAALSASHEPGADELADLFAPPPDGGEGNTTLDSGADPDLQPA